MVAIDYPTTGSNVRYKYWQSYSITSGSNETGISSTRIWANGKYYSLTPEERKPPKNWRWFHIFFEYTEMIVREARVLLNERLLKLHDPCSLKQRREKKRRMFVQSLYAG